jgi:hypothetical protein
MDAGCVPQVPLRSWLDFGLNKFVCSYQMQPRRGVIQQWLPLQLVKRRMLEEASSTWKHKSAICSWWPSLKSITCMHYALVKSAGYGGYQAAEHKADDTAAGLVAVQQV